LCEKLLPQVILKVLIFSRRPKVSSSELAEGFWEKDEPSKLPVAGVFHTTRV